MFIPDIISLETVAVYDKDGYLYVMGRVDDVIVPKSELSRRHSCHPVRNKNLSYRNDISFCDSH